MAKDANLSSNNSSLNLDEYSYDEVASKSIFELLDLDLPEAKRQQMEQKMVETIQNRAIARVCDLLSDQDTNEWQSLQDEQSRAEFLEQRGINIGEIMLKEAVTHKLELLSLGKTLKNKIEDNAQ